MNHFFPPQKPAPRAAPRASMPAIVPQNVLRALIGQSKKRCAAYAEMVDKLDAGMTQLRFEAERLAQSSAPDEATARAAREYFDAILAAFAQNRQHLEAQAHYELRLQDVLGRWLATSASPAGPVSPNMQVPRGFRRAPAPAPAFARPPAQSPFPSRTLAARPPQRVPGPAPLPSAFAPYFVRPAPALEAPAPAPAPARERVTPPVEAAAPAPRHASNGSALAEMTAPVVEPVAAQSDDDSAP